jgi:hypothetical protein
LIHGKETVFATFEAHREGNPMSGRQIIAGLLILGGILGLVYGGFSFTKETHEAKIGPFEMNVKEKEHVNIPLWAGVGAIVVGALLLIPTRRTANA